MLEIPARLHFQAGSVKNALVTVTMMATVQVICDAHREAKRLVSRMCLDAIGMDQAVRPEQMITVSILSFEKCFSSAWYLK